MVQHPSQSWDGWVAESSPCPCLRGTVLLGAARRRGPHSWAPGAPEGCPLAFQRSVSSPVWPGAPCWAVEASPGPAEDQCPRWVLGSPHVGLPVYSWGTRPSLRANTGWRMFIFTRGLFRTFRYLSNRAFNKFESCCFQAVASLWNSSFFIYHGPPAGSTSTPTGEKWPCHTALPQH